MEYEYIKVYKTNEEKPYGVIRKDLVRKFDKKHFETKPLTATRALEIIAEMATSTVKVERQNS